MNLLLVGAGGFIGAVARYLLSGWVHRSFQGSFPAGTLIVNVSGCLAIGGMLYLIEDRGLVGPQARLFWAIGILGGFTTFSSFGYETMELLRAAQVGRAFLNVAGNVLLGLGAVWLGRALLKTVCG